MMFRSLLARRTRELTELLASMRFAIALLTLICIASVIGTVVLQRRPYNDYVNQFGPFWAAVFDRLDLFTVYSAPWFLLILAFLVISTSLCIVRQTPKVVRDWQDTKLKVRVQSLAAFPHHADCTLPQALPEVQARLHAQLQQLGWTPRQAARDDGQLLAARKGKVHKLGYFAAHGAIVLVCVGGLLDGDLLVRASAWWQGKALFTGSTLQNTPLAPHTLSAQTPSFRANLFVPDGERADTAVLNMPGGLLLQKLPFELELERFIVEYYDTGMPKLFASDVVLHDGADRVKARIEVNKPLLYKGLAIYQSSFEDGGSAVRLRVEPLRSGSPAVVSAQVGGGAVALNGTPYRLEVGELRTINVEDFSRVQGAEAAASAPAAGSLGAVKAHLGSGAKPEGEKRLRNIGPSIKYRLRDAAGQAREFHNYMVPTELNGVRVFLAGLREDAASEFRYLRIPADENDSLQAWLRLSRALADPALRRAAALDYATHATEQPALRAQLAASGERSLALFAEGGLVKFSEDLEQRVPEAERAKVSDIVLRILNGNLVALDVAARRAAGVPVPPDDEARQAFMTQALLSLSDASFYPPPVLLQLDAFEQRQASVFQVARAPGQKLVYAGAVLLILGVFAMLYIRERRVWLWLSPTQDGGTRVLLALSSPREGSDTEQEFAQLKTLIAPHTP